MKTHQKLFAVIGLLSLTPTLMAFTRTPYGFTTSHYDLIEVTASLVESDPDKTYNIYEFTVKNTGNDYVVKSGTYTCYSNSCHELIRGENDDPLFYDTLLQKDAVYTFRQSLNKELDPVGASFDATAYIEPGSNTSYDGTHEISKDEEHPYMYIIDAEVLGRDNDHSYAYIVTLEYDGVEHCFISSPRPEDNKLIFRVKDDSFDIAKAEVKKIVSYQTDNYKANYAGYALGGALYIGLIFLGILTAVFLFLVLPLIIMSSIYRKKQRQAKEKDAN